MTYVAPVLPTLLLICFLAFCRRPTRWTRLAGLAAVAGLFLWAWPPMAILLSKTLESEYPIRTVPEGDGDAIVVLSSSVYSAQPSIPEEGPGAETELRCRYAAWLYHHWRALPVVASGGKAPTAVAGEVMRKVLEADGVPPAMIWTEDRSRSTYENARFTAPLLQAKGIRRIVLVTEAFHMRRAEACFRKQGFLVTPAPCGYRSTSKVDQIGDLVPNSRSIAINDEVLHEWVGLAWYRASGKI